MGSQNPVFVMIIAFLTYGLRTHPFSWIPLQLCPVTPSSLQSVFDDKSGYDHVQAPYPRKSYLFWCEWGAGTLPATLFRLDGNPRPIFTILLVFSLLTIFALSSVIPCSLYMDEIQLPSKAPAYAGFSSASEQSFSRASSAIFIVCYTLINFEIFYWSC